MELPTYTSIWRIEKRLYKLYDFRLPMPLPVGQIVVFAAITVPYVLILTMMGLPFSHSLFWLYVLPPGALTWLATRPVLESKRLPELALSQLRYLAEPATWCRMAPLAERDEIIVQARVWRRFPQAALAVRSTAVDAGGAAVDPAGLHAEDQGRMTQRGAAQRGAWQRGVALPGPARQGAAPAGTATRATAPHATLRDGAGGSRAPAGPAGPVGPATSPPAQRSRATVGPRGMAEALPDREAAIPASAMPQSASQAPACHDDDAAPAGGAGTAPLAPLPGTPGPGTPLPGAPGHGPADSGPGPGAASGGSPDAAPDHAAQAPAVPSGSAPSGSAGAGVAPRGPSGDAPAVVVVPARRSGSPPGPLPPARAVERALSGAAPGRTVSWRDRVLVVPGGRGPRRPDFEHRDTARAVLPLQEPRVVVVLGCTVGAGQTVTTLMLADLLASLRGEPVAALDANPGPASLVRMARTPAIVSSALLGAAPPAQPPGRPRGRGRLDVIVADASAEAADGAIRSLARALRARYQLSLVDPGAPSVARMLAAADQLLLVAPSSPDASRAVAMTCEWLGANGYQGLAARSIAVLNGVSKRSLPYAQQAETVVRGRCRAIVRIPWDDHLAGGENEQAIRDSRVTAGGSSRLAHLRPPVRQAYTALAGVLVAALADGDQQRRAAR